MIIKLSDRWNKKEPDAYVGLLLLKNISNQNITTDFSNAKRDLEDELRSRYKGMDRKSLRQECVMSSYDSFYRKFKKTYHVQLQLESVVFNGKPITSPLSLVTCMFMAELKTGLLTAGHDIKLLKFPLLADVSRGGESYQKMDGSLQHLKEGDLYIKDQDGILSSVIYGPDQRTQISRETDQAAFTTYGPRGITPSQIQEQLTILEGYVRLFTPDLERELLLVLPSD